MVKDVVNSGRHRRKFWKASLPLNLGNKRSGDREYCHQRDCHIFSCGRHLSLPYWHQLSAMLPGLLQRWGSSHCFAVVSPQSHHSVWKLAFHVSNYCLNYIIFSLTSTEESFPKLHHDSTLNYAWVTDFVKPIILDKAVEISTCSLLRHELSALGKPGCTGIAKAW